MPTGRHEYRMKRQRLAFKRARALVLLGAMAALIVLLVFWIRRPASDVAANAPGPEITLKPTSEPGAASGATTAPAGSAEIAPEPTAAGEDALLPILTKVRVDGMQVAITVDDCYRTQNVNAILDVAEACGARLTFFPVGRALTNDPATWVRVHELGHEIESHGYTHTNMLRQTEEEITRELVSLNTVLNNVLGVQYTMHFLRTPGGDARQDIRVHRIMAEMGYKAMAHWSLSGSGNSAQGVVKTIMPGQVVLYHATDKDLDKLLIVIPQLMDMGFELVTLNELIELEPNETAPLPENKN